MWISQAVFELFGFSKDALAGLREELAAVKAERDTLKHHNLITQNNLEWIRVRVNALEAERSGLIEKAYGIKLPAPEVVSMTPSSPIDWDPRNFSFEHVPEDTAKKLGIEHLLS